MYTKFEHFVSFCFLDSRTQRLELWIDVPNIVIFSHSIALSKSVYSPCRFGRSHSSCSYKLNNV